jgi:hypothetical protein
MSQGVCPSCGASAVNEAGSCVYCGTLRQPSNSLSERNKQLLKEILEKRPKPKVDINSIEFKKEQLLKEICFLEKQYKELALPSILTKLENAQNKLRALT